MSGAASAAGKLHTHDAGARCVVYSDGQWFEGDQPIFSAMSPASWLSSVVFDGGRAFAGVAPDLDLHCQRVVASAHILGIQSPLTAGEIEDLCWEGIRRFPKTAELYVRPMVFAGAGFVTPEPGSARISIVVHEAPLPGDSGFSACVSSFRRPSPESAPTEAKASCLYPNVARCMQEATERGFDNAIVRDMNGNVAELATANLFIAKDGVAITPAANGTFLNGITRQRVVALFNDAGVPVEERRVTVEDVLEADEVFSTGNHAKVRPITRVEECHYQAGPIGRRARDLYFDYAASTPSRW